MKEVVTECIDPALLIKRDENGVELLQSGGGIKSTGRGEDAESSSWPVVQAGGDETGEGLCARIRVECEAEFDELSSLLRFVGSASGGDSG
jgi:hypothetical protein